MIDGVVFKDLVTHVDDRGFFREVLRKTDEFFAGGFGQWSHSMVGQGVVKAWHLHKIQTDWWYIACGVLRVGLYDTRPDSPTHTATMDFLLGDGRPAQVLKIPPGVAHGYKILQGPAHVLYVTSHVYNPDDELRLPEDAAEIDFDWQADADIT
jgi:dTDP-4-dehydrorhamnose 3,5-epimerase